MPILVRLQSQLRPLLFCALVASSAWFVESCEPDFSDCATTKTCPPPTGSGGVADLAGAGQGGSRAAGGNNGGPDTGGTLGLGGAERGIASGGGAGVPSGAFGGTGSALETCSANNGGCDLLSVCTNNAGATPTCGACPAGYLGTGATGCIPTLTALTLSRGTLAPALSADVTTYAASVSLGVQTIMLTPAVPPGATITVNSQVLAPGASWISPTLNLGANQISITVMYSGHPSRDYTLTVTREMMGQEAYVKASNTDASDRFGVRVALSGDGATLAVGANQEDSNSARVNGNQADNSASASGAVYVFTRIGEVWSQQAYLKAFNSEAGDWFGFSLALSSDGTTLAVGAYFEDSSSRGVDGAQTDNSAPSSGAVYVFTRSGGFWSQQSYLKASNAEANDQFGIAVGLSSDGATLAVGAPIESSNATGVNGNQADNSAPSSGAVYVFTRSGGLWSQQSYLKASNSGAYDSFGGALALAADGATLAVGASGEDGNATGVNGNQADNSADGSGAVYVFTRTGSTWSQQAYVKASNSGANDDFGGAVALSGDGFTLAVGAPYENSNALGVNGNQADNSADGSGSVYVFTRSASVWSQQAYVKASNSEAADHFGGAVALSGDGATLAASAPDEDSNALGVNGNQADNSADGSGSVYVFTRAGSAWSQQVYLKASNSEAYDNFGDALALAADGVTLAVGAFDEDGNATGVNGNQVDNSATASGAVFTFR